MNDTTHSTDRIQKRVVLKAPRERVWQAIADSSRFGTWFGVEIEGPFEPGVRVGGRLVPTTVDAEIGRQQSCYAGMEFDFHVDRIEPMQVFSFRWHPCAVEPDADYAKEPMTLVVFELADAPEGTLLTITESGFDQIPLARRAQAFASNDQGWTEQVRLIEKYLAQTA
ncbi:SRPBCC family protein [Dokdonella koreensis]|uniref:Activator of Hsp90 ATPase 1 family protein n=1 Tax=Dokdonella koreensis DS-123 TaxID=1300342 RepID=A0A167H987_9GAMM|nr:SRPBCC family protein [Dokdonella koreensis]ANB19536.1 Activator of Hsp90 ATPase 1 family protein [Dokdonella koreensis DS-123]